MLLARTAPTLIPPAPKIAAGAEVALLPTSAKICSAASAEMRDVAVGVDARVGDVRERLGGLLAVEALPWIVGSPISVSSAL